MVLWIPLTSPKLRTSWGLFHCKTWLMESGSNWNDRPTLYVCMYMYNIYIYSFIYFQGQNLLCPENSCTYPLVIQHSYGKSPCSVKVNPGKSSINGPCSSIFHSAFLAVPVVSRSWQKSCQRALWILWPRQHQSRPTGLHMLPVTKCWFSMAMLDYQRVRDIMIWIPGDFWDVEVSVWNGVIHRSQVLALKNLWCTVIYRRWPAKSC